MMGYRKTHQQKVGANNCADKGCNYMLAKTHAKLIYEIFCIFDLLTNGAILTHAIMMQMRNYKNHG
jgi:hypothetical protein